MLDHVSPEGNPMLLGGSLHELRLLLELICRLFLDVLIGFLSQISVNLGDDGTSQDGWDQGLKSCLRDPTGDGGLLVCGSLWRGHECQ